MAGLLGSIVSAIFGRKSSSEESELDKLVREADSNPEIAAEIHQLAALKRMESIHSLYEAGGSMAPISIEEQQAYVIMLDFMKNNSSGSGDEDMFNDFLQKVKTVHFKGNSILGSHLREIS